MRYYYNCNYYICNKKGFDMNEVYVSNPVASNISSSKFIKCIISILLVPFCQQSRIVFVFYFVLFIKITIFAEF